MSYDIYIGEAVLRDNLEEKDDDGELRAWFRVNVKALPEAPSFVGDTLTSNENHRHPGYCQWSEFTRIAGLEDLFFQKETGLMSRHPGCFRLQREHLEHIRAALTAYKRKYPDTNPGWQKGATGEDMIMARLIWLEFWVSWAIETCKVPAIYNS